MGEFVPLIVAVALIWKIVDFVKFARAGDVQATVTQLSVWGAGVGVAFLLRASDFASGIDVGGMVLGTLNPASVLLFGLGLGSTASGVVDFKKARDITDSAATPGLLTGKKEP